MKGGDIESRSTGSEGIERRVLRERDAENEGSRQYCESI